MILLPPIPTCQEHSTTRVVDTVGHIVYYLKMTKDQEKKQVKPLKANPDKRSLKLTLSKRNVILGILVLLFIILSATLYVNRSEFIIATVNGKPISRIKLIKTLEQQNGAQTLDNIITQELILQEGKNQNITITAQDVDAELKTIESSITAQGLTLEQALEAQGMTKKQLEEQIQIQKTLEKLVTNETNVTEEEINEAVTKMIESGQEDSPELREQIKQQLEQSKISQAIQTYLSNLQQTSEINILNSKFGAFTQ